jgi:hypothetical protein
MQTAERQRLTHLVQRVLRHLDQARDIEIDRAAARLMAARSDTPQLLLQHALALEAVLQQIQWQLQGLGAAQPTAAAGSEPSCADAPRRALAPAAGALLRDTAVIATGVLGGSLLFHGLAPTFEGSPPDAGAAEGADTDFGSELWG